MNSSAARQLNGAPNKSVRRSRERLEYSARIDQPERYAADSIQCAALVPGAGAASDSFGDAARDGGLGR